MTRYLIAGSLLVALAGCDDEPTVVDRPSPAVRDAKDAARDAADATKDAARDGADAVKDGARDLRDSVRD